MIVLLIARGSKDCDSCDCEPFDIEITNNFTFFQNTYYNNLIKIVKVVPYRCYDIGKFNSAIFSDPLIGKTLMFPECSCSGKPVVRNMKTQYAPGDNPSEYGKSFFSVIYIPDTI
ncbi:hypothetical protein AYI70_g312 [Smittium culicis]|uniref:Uncharacterized protein n=1 Tax=Smittium culicis TaxID=133412 RepID=A0A1R1YHB0_9FUNG|nr:hypothetical protein AYI70_g312 [Smittium culicis]